MDTSLLISTGGAIVGTAVGSVITASVLARKSERESVNQLLAQAQRAVTALQVEIESFSERRTSTRAQLMATAHVVIGGLSGYIEDRKWMSAATRELHALRDWDLREGDRFVARFLPAQAELSSAIVLLGLRDDADLREAAVQLGKDSVALIVGMGDARARKKATTALGKDLEDLTIATQAYLKQRWWRLGPLRPKGRRRPKRRRLCGLPEPGKPGAGCDDIDVPWHPWRGEQFHRERQLPRRLSLTTPGRRR
jgi:hypothetical protein